MDKIDLKKELKQLYRAPTNRVVPIDVPTMNYLMVDGAGDPNTETAFQDAIAALFPLAYTLKFMVKRGPGAIDYGVMPLEGLWWADDMSSFAVQDKTQWKWTLMIMQPVYISEQMVETAIDEVRRKKNPEALAKVRFESFAEGKAAQITHVGPFTEEGPAIEKVHQFIERCGCKRSGKHHEVYLSDIRKADPARWKTIIRQPMECSAGSIDGS